MGDRLIGDAPTFTLASWLELDRLWPANIQRPLQQQLLAIQRLASSEARSTALHQLYHRLMDDGLLLPLFNYRYQIFAPPGVEGIQLNTLGWFDFSRAWVAPPLAV